MTIPLYVILFIYLGFSAITLLFWLAIMYHLIRFGTLNFINLLFSLISIAGIALWIFYSYRYLIAVDWTQTISIFDVIRFRMPSLPQS